MNQHNKYNSIISIAISAILWIISVIIMIDSKSFNNNLFWPVPYKDSVNFNFGLYFTVFFISLILFTVLTFLKNNQNDKPIYLLIAFELFTYLSPIFYKKGTSFNLYISSLFDVTQERFFTRTLKSAVIITSLVLLIIALKSHNKKTIICFAVSAFIMISISIVHLIIISKNYTISIKDVSVCLLRVLPILPLYFLNFVSKESR